jgi:ankyrin repeat protein/nucleoside-triphosphatase THEP1
MDVGRYESGLEQQAKGTLSWVQSKSEYVRWKESDVSGLLWVTGHPGCGKTTLALFVTHALADHTRPHDIVCRFFCNENEPSHDASALLRALIYQIISRRRRLLKVVRKASDRGGMQTLRQFDALWDIFVKIACDNRVASISIIIDGIEGYDRKTQTKLIRRISELIRSGAARQVKFFITSRPHALALQYIDVDPAQMLLLRMENEQQVIEQDVNLFIHQRLELLVRTGSCKSSTRDELEKILVSKAGRTFLWVSLILPLLEERRVLSTADVTSIVAQLPPDLAVTYEKLLDMISPHEQKLVARLLRLIVVSARALTGYELSILMEITPDHHSARSLEEDQLQMDSRMVLLVLGPLVRVSDSKISLIHISLKDYLLDLGKTPSHRLSETFGVDMQRDTRILVSACVYYLGLDEFGGEIFQREILGDNDLLSSDVSQAAEADVTISTLPFDIFNEPLFHNEQEQDIELGMQVANRYKLFDYAAVHWMRDLFRCDVGVVQDLVDPISVICGSEQIRLTNWLRYFWMRTGMTEQCIAADPLIVACYFGHVYLLQTYLNSLQECQSETIWTALFWAAREGHISCVTALLRHRKTTNIPKPSISSIAPLHAAAQCGHLECVEALLKDDRINVNSYDSNGRTALSLASANGHSDVVTALFLHKAIDVNLPDKSNYTAVFWWAVAVKSGPASSPFLTDLRVNLDHVDKQGRTPLSWAAEEGTETAVDGLIRSQRITIGRKDSKGRTPISYAAQNGHHEVVRLLYNSQPKQALIQDHTGRNAYSWAADQPNSRVLSELLKLHHDRGDINGADVEDENGWAPLAWALNPPGFPENVRTLIESEEVDLNRKDKTEGRTPLSLAAAYGLTEIVGLLLSKKDIILDSKDVNGRTPLSYAAGRGNVGVISQLLPLKGVDINSTDKTGCTPLSWAAREGCCEVITLLLSHPQIDCSVRDASGRLPLQVALAYGQDRAADILQANTVEARRDARQ